MEAEQLRQQLEIQAQLTAQLQMQVTQLTQQLAVLTAAPPDPDVAPPTGETEVAADLNGASGLFRPPQLRIPEYYGRKDKTYKRPERYLADFDAYLGEYPALKRNPATLARFWSTNSLKGDAKEWFDSLRDLALSSGECATAEEFYGGWTLPVIHSRLVQQFSNPYEESYAAQELSKIRQGADDAQTYATRFRQLREQCGGLVPARLAQTYFVTGLSSVDHHRELLRLRPNNQDDEEFLEELIWQAATLEAAERAIRSGRAHPSTSREHHQPRDYRGRYRPGRADRRGQYVEHAASPPPRQQPPALQPAPPQQPRYDGPEPMDLSHVTCYNCRQKGHYANACPEPRRQRAGAGGHGGGQHRSWGGRRQQHF